MRQFKSLDDFKRRVRAGRKKNCGRWRNWARSIVSPNIAARRCGEWRKRLHDDLLGSARDSRAVRPTPRRIIRMFGEAPPLLEPMTLPETMWRCADYDTMNLTHRSASDETCCATICRIFGARPISLRRSTGRSFRSQAM